MKRFSPKAASPKRFGLGSLSPAKRFGLEDGGNAKGCPERSASWLEASRGSASMAGVFGKYKRAGVHQREALQSDQRDLGEALRFGRWRQCQRLPRAKRFVVGAQQGKRFDGWGIRGMQTGRDSSEGSASAWEVFLRQSASVLDARNKRSASRESASFVKLGRGLMGWREIKKERGQRPSGRPLPAGY